MSASFWFLAAYFLFVAGAVTAVGFLYLRALPALAGGEPGRGFLHNLLARTLLAVGEKTAPKKEAPVRRQLFQAGYRTHQAMALLGGIRFASAVTLGLIVFCVALVVKGKLTAALVPALSAGGFGYILPMRILDARSRARRERVRRGIPVGVDLLVLSIEAGQTLDQAMQDTAQSLAKVHPDLSAELLFCHLEMRAGKGRADALRHLAERSSEPEVAKLASLLLDGERFGASLAPALRNHARYLRTRMRHRAQESARKLGVKLVFPVFFLIFPSVLLVTLGPAYLQMRKSLTDLLGP